MNQMQQHTNPFRAFNIVPKTYSKLEIDFDLSELHWNQCVILKPHTTQALLVKMTKNKTEYSTAVINQKNATIGVTKSHNCKTPIYWGDPKKETNLFFIFHIYI